MGKWKGTRAERGQSYPVNPYKSTTAEEMWRFWVELHDREPSTQLGGFYAKKPGYHGKPSELTDRGAGDSKTDYSIRSSRDRGGPNLSAAIDWTFPEAWNGDRRRFAMYGARVKAAFLTRDPRLTGWREWLGHTDTDSSLSGEGLDFYTWTTRTPDDSHNGHAHGSKTRSRLRVWADYTNMLSILDGESLVEYRERLAGKDTMTPAQEAALKAHVTMELRRAVQTITAGTINPLTDPKVNPWVNETGTVTLNELAAGLDALGVTVRGSTDRVVAEVTEVPGETVLAFALAPDATAAARSLVAALGSDRAAELIEAMTNELAGPAR